MKKLLLFTLAFAAFFAVAAEKNEALKTEEAVKNFCPQSQKSEKSEKT